MRPKSFSLATVRCFFFLSLIVLSLACSSQRKQQSSTLPYMDVTFGFKEKLDAEARDKRIAELEKYFRSYVKEAFPNYTGTLKFAWFAHMEDGSMVRMIAGDEVATGSAPKPPTPPPPPIMPPGEFNFIVDNFRFMPLPMRRMN